MNNKEFDFSGIDVSPLINSAIDFFSDPIIVTVFGSVILGAIAILGVRRALNI